MRFLALFLPFLFLISGCARSGHVLGVLHLAQESDPTTLDPARSYDTTSISFVRLLYRGLVDYDQQANLFDEAAQSHTVSPDGKTYTFKIRPDLKFHSGASVTAEDFRFALERVLDPKTASDGLTIYTMIDGAEEWSKDRAGPKKLEHIRGIEVQGEHTLIFHLKTPDVTFINWLTLPFAYAVNKKHVLELEKQGLELSENPDGNGPFKMTEWVHDGWLTLDKNPAYYHPELPKSNRIEVQFGISPPLQLMMFEQGNLDIMTLSDAFPADFLRLKNSAKWQPLTQHAPMMDMRYLALNNEKKPFDDARVRRAMNYGINRARIAALLTGRAILARGALPPGIPAYNSQLVQYAYDPEKARSLLQEAGYQDNPNAPQTLWYATNEPWYGKAAQSIQADLKKIGMTIEIKGLRYGDLKAKAGRRGAISMSLLGWVQDFPDPANFLDVLFNKKNISDESALNRTFYSNPKVNDLLDKAITELDREKRLQMYRDVEKIVVQDAPMVFLHHTERYVAHQPWIEGFQLHPMWSATYEDVAVN